MKRGFAVTARINFKKTDTVAAKKSGKTGWVLGGAVGLILLIAMCSRDDNSSTQNNAVAGSVTSTNEAAEAALEPAKKVTAMDLATAYEDNEAAAQKKFGGRPLLVTGTVSGVKLDAADDPYVEMTGRNPFLGVRLDLAEEAKSKADSFSKGQKLTFLCEEVGEVMGIPVLKGCAPTN